MIEDTNTGQARGCRPLVWSRAREPCVVRYAGGVRDPSGNMGEYRYGQSLGLDLSRMSSC
jgi:hypothetical protein